MPKYIWQCERTSRCCKLFVFTGVQVSNREWKLLEKDIKLLKLSKEDFEKYKSQHTLPVVGKNPPKKCAFLKGKNICVIYKKRPKRCREYPIMVQQYKDSVVFHVSDDCPRGKELASIIETKTPPKLNKLIGKRKIKVILESFFEKSTQAYYDEES
ncbi:MAG: YkgJ family cysteine cluster protein [Candidatus Omnitrophota bacterium]